MQLHEITRGGPVCVPLTQELSPHGGMSPAPACAHLLSSTRFISCPGSRPAMEARTEGVPRLPRRRPSLVAAPARSRPGPAAQLRAPFLKYHRQGARGVASRATFLPRRSRLVVGCPCPSSFLVLAEQGSGVWTDHGVVSCPVGGGSAGSGGDLRAQVRDVSSRRHHGLLQQLCV